MKLKSHANHMAEAAAWASAFAKKTGRPLAALAAACWLLGRPAAAWALQVHPAPEGLIAHQLAHVFFIATLGILAYWLRPKGLVQQRGWRLVRWACFLFILWNFCALSGHYLSTRVSAEMFVGSGAQLNQRLVLSRSPALAIFYYLTNMDHLLCVPAIVVLFLGIRDFYLATEKKGLAEDD